MKPIDLRSLRSVQPLPAGEALEIVAELTGVLEAIPQMVWASFPAPGGGLREYYNRQWVEFTGASLAPDGSTRAEMIHPDDRERALARWAHSRATGEDYEAEYRIRHHTGEYRWILSRGRMERAADGSGAAWYGTCTDIHNHVLAREALHESEEVNRTIIQASEDHIKLLDSSGAILFVNAAAAADLNARGHGNAIGASWLEILPAGSAALAAPALQSALAGHTARFTTFWIAEGGEARWRDYAVSPVVAADGKVERVVVNSRDITQKKLVQEELQWTASHDALTRLPNRSFFHECIGEAIRQAAPLSRRIGLLVLDVDNLNQVNDALGHEAGDRLLCEIAQRLQAACGPGDVIGRLGGDEFGLLLTSADTAAEIAAHAQAILETLRSPFGHDGCLLDCRASIGASLYPDQGREADELLKQADLALSTAKAGGRMQVAVFDPKMRAEIQTRSSMLSLTRDALRDGRIVPFYQPKIDLDGGGTAGFEALLRWRDRGDMIHLPATIAAAFDDAELAPAITDAMVDAVVRDVSGWLAAGVEFGHVAINAAAADFRNPSFAEDLLERLRRAAIPPERIQLEVTETVFLGRGAECVESALRRLSSSGLKIALDDFGTGYASLSHLKRFPVDLLKIDRSFVRDLEHDEDSAAIVTGIINLANSIRIDVVAEGVETEGQARFLRSRGCRFGQGYLFGKASPGHVVPWLAAAPPALASRA